MARTFTGASNPRLEIGDVGKFEFASAWTSICMVSLLANSTLRAAVAKWSNQFFQGFNTANNNIDVRTAGTSRITGTEVLNANQWYGYAVINDGTGAAGGLRALVYSLPDLTKVVDRTGQHPSNDASNTDPVRIGGRDGGFSEITGTMAHVIYVNGALSEAEVRAYCHDPEHMAAIFKRRYGVTYYFPIYGKELPEPDKSGSGLTAVAVNADPPAALFGVPVASSRWLRRSAAQFQDQPAAPAGGLLVQMMQHGLFAGRACA